MGTRIGYEKAKQTILKRKGSPEAVHAWRQEIGRLGGEKSRSGGFASDKLGPDGLTGKERAKLAGAKGGKAKYRRRHV